MVERNQLRDKTLVLRILDERLQSRLREKMSALEEESTKQTTNPKQPQHMHSSSMPMGPTSSSIPTSNSSASSEGKIFDLEGVTCEPAIQAADGTFDKSDPQVLDQHTLWNFHCDGATYPARLINLPCPVELHKTHDHAMYYKCVDIAQMLIVYEDMNALEEAESMPGYKADAYPSYYHSGLTPPMTKVVARRFQQRENSAVPPLMSEVLEVEKDLIALIEAISTKDPNKRVGRGNNAVQRSMQTKVLEEVEDEIVDYEPWMDNNGKDKSGIEFDESDAICKQHPELWLDPEENRVPAIMDAAVVGNSDGAPSSSKGNKKDKPDRPEKKAPKKVKKPPKKEITTPVATSPSPVPPPDVSRPMSTTSQLDSLNIDEFDFDLDGLGGLGDDDFDMEGIVE